MFLVKKLLYISLLIFISCSAEATNESAAYKLNIDPLKTEDINLSEFVGKVSFLKLSSKDGSYFASADKVIISDNKIFILDKYQALTLFVYDKNGQLLYKINKYGRGPGEFKAPADFVVDKKNKRIIIYDLAGIKLMEYNLKNGSFIKEKILDFIPSTFTQTDSGYVFFNNNSVGGKSDFNVIFTNPQLTIEGKYLKINPNLKGFYYNLPLNFTSYKSQHFLTVPFDNTIYRIKGNLFERYLKVDFGEMNLDPSFYDKYEDSRKRLEKRDGSAYNITNYFETDKFKFFLYKVEQEEHYYLESKVPQKVIHTTFNKLNDDIGIGPLTRWPVAKKDNTLIWFQQPKRLLDYLSNKRKEMTEEEWGRFKEKNQQLISFAETIKENDNPYLIFLNIDFTR